MNNELMEKSMALRSEGINPTLALVRLGNRPDDMAYERGAKARAKATGVDIREFVFDENIQVEDLLNQIDLLNKDDEIHGILVFRPLPSHIDDEAVRNAVSPEKDVDGITYVSQAGVYVGDGMGYPPCTAAACMEILRAYDIDVRGKNVVVIGRSQVIGRPVAMMLIEADATVTVCHTKTKNTQEICKNSDIIIVAAGKIGTITKEHLSPGQVVIDVAINFNDEGKMIGDVDFEVAEKIVGAITPVPGGVGRVTTGILMKHTIDAAKKE